MNCLQAPDNKVEHLFYFFPLQSSRLAFTCPNGKAFRKQTPKLLEADILRFSCCHSDHLKYAVKSQKIVRKGVCFYTIHILYECFYVLILTCIKIHKN